MRTTDRWPLTMLLLALCVQDAGATVYPPMPPLAEIGACVDFGSNSIEISLIGRRTLHALLDSALAPQRLPPPIKEVDLRMIATPEESPLSPGRIASLESYIRQERADAQLIRTSVLTGTVIIPGGRVFRSCSSGEAVVFIDIDPFRIEEYSCHRDYPHKCWIDCANEMCAVVPRTYPQ